MVVGLHVIKHKTSAGLAGKVPIEGRHVTWLDKTGFCPFIQTVVVVLEDNSVCCLSVSFSFG